MNSLQKHLNDARRRLLYPTRASCDDNILTPHCMDVLDELLTKIGNSHEPGFIATVPLTINSGIATYPLDDIAPDYGKARYLYENQDRVGIEFVGLELLTERYGGGSVVGTPPNRTYPLTYKAAVYYDAEQGNMLEIAPLPASTFACTFTYELATNRPQTKRSAGFHLEQFDSLVAAKTALKALLHCQWKGLDRKEAREQRMEIRDSLLFEIGDKESRRGLDYLFWQFCLTTVNKTNDTSVGFGKGTWW